MTTRVHHAFFVNFLIFWSCCAAVLASPGNTSHPPTVSRISGFQPFDPAVSGTPGSPHPPPSTGTGGLLAGPPESPGEPADPLGEPLLECPSSISDNAGAVEPRGPANFGPWSKQVCGYNLKGDTKLYSPVCQSQPWYVYTNTDRHNVDSTIKLGLTTTYTTGPIGEPDALECEHFMEQQWLTDRLKNVKVISKRCAGGNTLPPDQLCKFLQQAELGDEIMPTLRAVLNSDKNLRGVPATINKVKGQLLRDFMRGDRDSKFLTENLNKKISWNPNKSNRALRQYMVLHKDDAVKVAGDFRQALIQVITSGSDFTLESGLGEEDWEHNMSDYVDWTIRQLDGVWPQVQKATAPAATCGFNPNVGYDQKAAERLRPTGCCPAASPVGQDQSPNSFNHEFNTKKAAAKAANLPPVSDNDCDPEKRCCPCLKKRKADRRDLLARPLFAGLPLSPRDDTTCENPDDEEEAEDSKEDDQQVNTGLLKALPAFAAAGGLSLAAMLPGLDRKTRGQCRKAEHAQIMIKIKAYSAADASPTCQDDFAALSALLKQCNMDPALIKNVCRKRTLPVPNDNKPKPEFSAPPPANVNFGQPHLGEQQPSQDPFPKPKHPTTGPNMQIPFHTPDPKKRQASTVSFSRDLTS